MTSLRNEYKEEDDSGVNVLGQEDQASEDQITPSGDAGAGNTGAITSQPQSTTQGGIRPSSSGSNSRQFTDVKKYIDKNKPQGARIAQKAESGIQSQASIIGQNAKARKSALSNVIQQNKDQIAEDQKAAFAAVDATQNITPVTNETPAAADVNSNITPPVIAPLTDVQSGALQTVSSGNFNVSDVPQLDLASQEIAARRLGNTQNVLQDTFAKPGRQYTSGQQKLDQLLLGGTGEASKLQDSAQAASKATLDQLGGYRQQVVGEMANQGKAETDAKNALQTKIDNIKTALTENASETDITTQVATRNALLKQYDEVKNQYDTRMGDIRNLYNQNPYGSGGFEEAQFNKMLVRSLRGDSGGSDGGVFRGVDMDSTNRSLNSQDLARMGIDETWYNDNVARIKADAGSDTPYLSFADELRQKISNADLVQDQLATQGYNEDVIRSGSDINRSNIMSEDDIARYNAIQAATGNTSDIVTPGSNKYLSDADLQTFIDNYGGTDKYSEGTPNSDRLIR